MVIRRRYLRLLQQLDLVGIDRVKAARGEIVKDQRGKRDVIRLVAGDSVFFLKRVWKPKFKHGLQALLTRGRVRSQCGIEWDNLRLLRQHRIRTPELVAYGEEIVNLRERFSFILTRAAPGEMDLRDFVEQEHDPERRRRVLEALVQGVRRFHDAGFATPDLFARHLFIEWRGEQPRFTMIDLQRLDRRRRIGDRLRARDLAALNSSLPNHLVSPAERLRFLEMYRGRRDRAFFSRVRRRMEHLLVRNKRLNFYTPAPRTSQTLAIGGDGGPAISGKRGRDAVATGW